MCFETREREPGEEKSVEKTTGDTPEIFDLQKVRTHGSGERRMS